MIILQLVNAPKRPYIDLERISHCNLSRLDILNYILVANYQSWNFLMEWLLGPSVLANIITGLK